MLKEKLVDEESKILYEIRKDYCDTEDYISFMKKILNIKKEWFVLDRCFEAISKAAKQENEIIIYGCGMYGVHTKFALQACGIQVNYFCDGNTQLFGKKKLDVEIISPEELVRNHQTSFVIISMKNCIKDVFDFLVNNAFSKDKIAIPQDGILVSFCGNQYFDFFEPEENEVFVDAGAYDGMTTIEFIKWAKKGYSNIYVLEPYKAIKPSLDKNLEGISNTHCVYKAAWNKNEEIYFGGEFTSFGIENNDEIVKINGTKIDDIVGDDRVTFIKMDIEGSEYNALLGAENTIRKNKPKLAICIYHKPGDIIELPNLIEKMVPEYKYAIRHYTAGTIETVLYAWI